MNLPAILCVVIVVLGVGAVAEGFALKASWQREAATKQALTQAAKSMKDLHDATKERTGVETGCSGFTLDQLIERLHSGAPCR